MSGPATDDETGGAAGGGEGTDGDLTHDESPESAGGRVEARIFLGIGAFLVLATVVYAVTAREEAGVALLLLAGGVGVVIGGYLALQARRTGDAADARSAPPPEGEYLPAASVWPFGMGVGSLLVANGLALGAWAVLPGLALGALSLYGFMRQGRRRD